MPRTSVLPQDQSDDGLLNDETRAVVVALSDAAESIKLARDGRKKALATKYATPEKRLEERLEAAAVGLTSSFANLCRDFGAEFRDFDSNCSPVSILLRSAY